MAGARAAASLSLTIGVAFVTVLIVGGILAGPTILDCSHQPSRFGACLRDRLDHSRLAPVKDEPSQAPVLSSESAAPSAPESPPSHQADLGHPDGWLDARANEYEPPATSALEPPALPPLPDLVTPPAPVPPAASSSTVAEIEIVPPPLPHQRPAPPAIKPRADIKQPVTTPQRVAKIVPKPPVPKPAPRAKPVRTFKYDPRYPNVTVLPPPAKGSGSSFVTLPTH